MKVANIKVKNVVKTMKFTIKIKGMKFMQIRWYIMKLLLILSSKIGGFSECNILIEDIKGGDNAISE